MCGSLDFLLPPVSGVLLLQSILAGCVKLHAVVKYLLRSSMALVFRLLSLPFADKHALVRTPMEEGGKLESCEQPASYGLV